ncbi:FAD binding domain-containing protein [Nocardioides aquiterrae]|uniref:Xanthine dehydrogenase family protein subunit M n=1 Tax=Nocardioides aquiterrae TaxID=203799 RepID=A0ABN1UFK3_9ACTN
MKPFDYLTPAHVDEAVGLLADRGDTARVIAGGQSLLLAMKQRDATPRALVAVGRIPALSGWSAEAAGRLSIGAATSYATLERAELPGWHAEIAAVAGNLADRPVRTMGTIGGALCQADPRFDMPTVAVGVDAELELLSVEGGRRVPAAAFFDPAGGARCGATELLTTLSVPGLERFTGAAFQKFRVRTFDAALASVLCAARVDEAGRLEELRVVVGAVAPAPLVVEGVAADLAGAEAASLDTVGAGRAVAEEAVPLGPSASDLRRYQRELVAVLARDAIRRATETSRS